MKGGYKKDCTNDISKSILMAIIGSAHGTSGEVRIKSFTKNPVALGDYGLLHDKDGKFYRIESFRLKKSMVITRFSGINNRSSAETLNGTALFIERTQLPDNLGEDEFYQNDLLGFTAFDAVNQRVVGYISAFLNFGGGDLIELAMKDRRKQLIPFSKAAIPDIDMSIRQIVVDPAASGLTSGEDCETQEK